MNASDLRLTSHIERFDRFFNIWLANQVPQTTTAVPPQVVPANVPPLVSNHQDQLVYNPFSHDKNYLQPQLGNSKQSQSHMKFELP